MDETRLVQEAQKGDFSAFDKLYCKYIKMVFGFVYNKIGRKEEAEDITSEIWLSVVLNLSKFQARSTFKNWLFGIVKHKILDYYYDKYRVEKIPLVEEIFLVKETDEKDHSDKENIIRNILDKLPEKYQTVLSLRFLRRF